jgi:CRISPR-associated endonuclease/helicase Cas3
MTYYAHSNGLDKQGWQKLKDHLEHTAELARELGRGSGLAEFAVIAAWLHDIGKYSPAFQRRLAGANLRVDHCTCTELVR